MSDTQTGSIWDVRTGKAIQGAFAGKFLKSSSEKVEQVFPYRGVKPYSTAWLAIWQRFDANWYQKIAERGYSSDDGSTAFFPLYPFLTRIVALTIRDAFLAALIVSNLSVLGILFLFHQLVTEYSDAETARRAMIYLLLFPASFFLFAGYTEATYLMFSVAAFFFALRKRWWVVALCGALAASTRGVGILLILPMLYLWWVQGMSRRWQDAFGLLSIPSAVGIFLLANRFSTITIQQSKWETRFSFPWEHFFEYSKLLANHKILPIDMFNLFVSLLFAFLCIEIWRKLPRELGIYAIAMFLLPLFRLNAGQPFGSAARYTLMIFPAFILLGKCGRNPWVNRAILYTSLPALLFFSAQFWMWGWV
jgi:hypothetical protein